MTYPMWADMSLHIHLKLEDIRAPVSLSSFLLVTDLGYRQPNHIHYQQGFLRSRNDPVSRIYATDSWRSDKGVTTHCCATFVEICISRPLNRV